MTKHCLWNCIGGIQSHERPTKFDFRWLSLEISTRKNNNNFISGHLNFRWRLLKRSASGKHCHTKKNENIKNHHLATSSLDPATASSSPDTTLPPNWFWGGVSSCDGSGSGKDSSSAEPGGEGNSLTWEEQRWLLHGGVQRRIWQWRLHTAADPPPCPNSLSPASPSSPSPTATTPSPSLRSDTRGVVEAAAGLDSGGCDDDGQALVRPPPPPLSQSTPYTPSPLPDPTALGWWGLAGASGGGAQVSIRLIIFFLQNQFFLAIWQQIYDFFSIENHFLWRSA